MRDDPPTPGFPQAYVTSITHKDATGLSRVSQKMTQAPHQLRQAVADAATRPEVAQAIDALYRDLAADIDQRRPVCLLSGRCCRFEDYGHRLYVTTLELAAFMRRLDNQIDHWDGTGCPFQVNKLCTVHPIRPFGCRVFFCDATATDWQHDAYERYHARLKALHEHLEVPYFYVEWRAALRLLIPTLEL
jgi:Fe-S-cluster containining protein